MDHLHAVTRAFAALAIAAFTAAALVQAQAVGQTGSSDGPRGAAQAPAEQTFWCPMHPNIRDAAGGRCAECGMSLVPIPPPAPVDAWLDVTADPAVVRAGRQTQFRFVVRERQGNAPLRAFDRIHERPMHLFVVNHELTYFDHVHPEMGADGVFTVSLTLPRPGAYRLVADLLPTGRSPVTLQDTVVTAGHAGSLLPAPAAPGAPVTEAVAHGVRVRFAGDEPRAGGDAHLAFEFSDARTGAPITDLEPLLGAWGHLLLVRTDLSEAAHAHPILEETAPGGPQVTFQALFAREGWYRVWVQVQRRGRLLTFDLTLRVGSST